MYVCIVVFMFSLAQFDVLNLFSDTGNTGSYQDWMVPRLQLVVLLLQIATFS